MELCFPTAVKWEHSELKDQHCKSSLFHTVLEHLLWARRYAGCWKYKGEDKWIILYPYGAWSAGRRKTNNHKSKWNIISCSQCYLSTWKEFTSQGMMVEGTAGAKSLWQKGAGGPQETARWPIWLVWRAREQVRDATEKVAEVSQAAPWGP